MNEIETKVEKRKEGLGLEVSGRNIAYCLQCATCNTCCPVRNFNKNFNPKEIVRRVLSEGEELKRHPDILYLCLLCGLCQEVCPLDLKVNELMVKIHQKLVAEGLGPLPQHKLVRKDQEWSTSESVTLAQSDPMTSECKRVFFPGCALSGYSPEIVIKIYSYLRIKLPGTGIILGCCGAPTHFLGDQSRFGEILGGVEDQMKRLGASELIAACPDCYHTIKYHSSHIKLQSIIEIIDEHGLPENMNVIPDKIFSLHDSCKARWEKDWLDSARSLVKKMGLQIEEMLYSRDKTRCCGMGGMVPYIDFDLASRIIKKRADEASHDILTYCAGCREALAFHKPAIHILDLIFNPNWEQAKFQPPKTGKTRRENQAKLKTLIQENPPAK